MLNPEVSVIMSCYNAEHTLNRAIESILNQTFENFEFIIIDDGSSDDTINILEEAANRDNRIRIIMNTENIGLAASLNKGIGVARAALIARMDADDEAYSERLGQQVDYLKRHKEVDILGCAVTQRSLKGLQQGIVQLPQKHEDIIKRVFRKTLVFHPTIIIRKNVFIQHGMYDPSLRWAEDADLWYRIYDKIYFNNLPQPLLYYTVKERLTLNQFYYNLKIKYSNLKRRNLLVHYWPQLIKDVIFMTIKMVRFR